MDLALEKEPLDQAARRAADFYAQKYESEPTTAEMLESIAISRRQAIINSSSSASRSDSSPSISTTRSGYWQEETSKDKTPIAAKQEVAKGTNTGEVTHARAKLHSGSVSNNKEAIRVNHSRHGKHDKKVLGIFTARHAAEKHPINYRDLAAKSKRPKHDSWVVGLRAEKAEKQQSAFVPSLN